MKTFNQLIEESSALSSWWDSLSTDKRIAELNDAAQYTYGRQFFDDMQKHFKNYANSKWNQLPDFVKEALQNKSAEEQH